jgi:hypothetical protein
MPDLIFFFKKSLLLRYNLPTIQLTYLKCVILCILIITVNFVNFYNLKKKP